MTSERIFCGGTFDFDVGESRKRFTLHKTIVGRLSEPLAASISNGMKGDNEGVAWLEDVDVDTFQRFAEWAYTGDYTQVVPCPAIVDQVSNDDSHPAEPVPEPVSELPADIPEVPAEDDPWQSFLPTTVKSKKKKKKGKHVLCGQDAEAEPFTPNPQHRSIGPFQFDAEHHAPFEEYDFSDCFLSHAQLYVFADQKQIGPLARLATTRLGQALTTAGRNKQRGYDMARLVDYVYNNTANLLWEQDSLRQDSLRRVVVDHAAHIFEVLAPTAEFRDLLSNGGDFVTEVSLAVASRIRWLSPGGSTPRAVEEEGVVAAW